MKKVLKKIFGVVCVVLGGIGIFIPILPTTPFLLLAAWLFVRSSDNLYDWLMEHPVFGLYIKSYIKYKGVEKRYKILAVTMLWLTIAISIYIVDKFWLKILLTLIATFVTIHILSLKTLSSDEIVELEKYELQLKINRSKKVNLKEVEH